MSTQEIIKELCRNKGISVSALEQELGFSNASLKGNGAIKSDRLLAVAKYFGVSMEYLMGASNIVFDDETHTWSVAEDEEYYIDGEAKDMAQFLFAHPEYRVLFDASRKVKPEDLKKALAAIGLFIDEE